MSKAKTLAETKAPNEANLKAEQPVAETPPAASAKEGETPVITFAPYSADPYYRTGTSTTLVEKSNALAATIWKDKEAYFAGKDHYSYSRHIEYGNTGKNAIIKANAEYFNQPKLRNALGNILSIDGVQSGGGANYYSSYSTTKIRELISKIASLEKKYGSDSILTDSKRDEILKRVLFRDILTENLGNNYNYHASVEVIYDKQPAAVNGLLSKDEMVLIANTINYVSRLRFLFNTSPKSDRDPVKTIESVLRPVNFNDIWTSTTTVSTESQALIDKMDCLPSFLGSVFPCDINRDFINKPRIHDYQTSDSYENVRNMSTKLRDISIKYSSEERNLSDLMETIVNLSESYINYYQNQTSLIFPYFDHLNRIEVEFKQMVNEVKEGYIERFSSPPF